MAQQELATISFHNGFEIPEEIQKRGSDSVYQCIGIKAYDSADGFTKLYHGRVLTANTNMWNKMQRHLKKGIYKGLFNNMFDKVVILHDPTIKPKKKKEVKNLSPQNKGKVKTMFGDGMSAEEIAAELNQPLNAVEKYINEKLK
jgi:hypothetical protein